MERVSKEEVLFNAHFNGSVREVTVFPSLSFHFQSYLYAAIVATGCAVADDVGG